MTGAIVLATEQGLGYLAKSFYDHKVIKKVLIKPHSSRTNYPLWFPEGKLLKAENYDWFFEGLDSVLYFEEPFDWKLLLEARRRGVKNILMPMYECTRYPFPYEPDLLLCPSLLDLDYYKNKNTQFTPVPVDVPWRLRKTARIFVHNAGNGGLGGRNGTRELLAALKYVKSDITLILRSQIPLHCTDPRVDVRIGTFDDIWSEGDVFIFPEKFNGLSLPLQEAHASGMMVMATDRFPMNTWLPTEPLISVGSYKTERIAVDFKSAIVDPQEIAKAIDYWYNKDITKFSLAGKEWARKHSWKELKPMYEKYLSK